MEVTDIEAAVLAAVDEGEAIALTQDLVRIPSIFPDEGKCASHLAERYSDYGLAVERQDIAPGRPNVFASIGGGQNDRQLLIEGHSDVVPLGEETQWTVDPWGGAISAGRLYGRGAADMKAGLAAAAVAARAIAKAGVKLKGKLRLAAFVDEENLMAGIRHFVQEGGAKGLTAAITVEPSGMTVQTCFCGRARADVTLLGQPGHAGIPPRSPIGKNAVHMAWPLIKEIEENAPPHLAHNLFGLSHWQVVSIAGGQPWEATVPAECTLRIDARMVPGHNQKDVWAHLQSVMDRMKQQYPGFDARITTIDEYATQSWSTSTDAEIVTTVAGAFRSVGGSDASINQIKQLPPGSGHTVKPSTDLHHIAALGIPSLNLGVRGGSVHMPDEYVEVQDIPMLAKMMALTAVRYLGHE